MDLDAYLERIGYDGPVNADLETLWGMHRAHWRTVPFENLDIQRGVPIVVDPERNYRKIVEAGRGGFCLELTGLFAWALREIGFKVDLLGARVLGPDGSPGEPRSHMCLLVHLDEPWLADVGFGGNISRPLRLHESDTQVDGTRNYLVANEADHWSVTCVGDTFGVTVTVPDANQSYRITPEPLEYGDFEAVCHWLQTSPDSRFTGGDIATLSSDGGRTTYAAGRLIESGPEGRRETEVSPGQVEALLRDRFSLRL